MGKGGIVVNVRGHESLWKEFSTFSKTYFNTSIRGDIVVACDSTQRKNI